MAIENVFVLLIYANDKRKNAVRNSIYLLHVSYLILIIYNG